MAEKEQIVEMFKMRLDGLSYKEIGEKFGISRQRVHQLICIGETKRGCKLDYVIYPGLKRWMQEKKCECNVLTKNNE